MLTLRPTSAFINDLLPTLGRPTMEMRPLCTKNPRFPTPRPNVGNNRRVFRSASALRLRGGPTDNGDEPDMHEESSVPYAAHERRKQPPRLWISKRAATAGRGGTLSSNSEERRGGKEGSSQCRSRGSAYN